MQELSTITSASIYNQVYHLQKPDYSRDVTEASQKAYILVLLTSSEGTNVESRVLIEIWRELAQKFGDVKFCQMRANLCIEGYPDKNTPTVLVYKDGDIKRQIVTLRELAGVRTKTTGMCYSIGIDTVLWDGFRYPLRSSYGTPLYDASSNPTTLSMREPSARPYRAIKSPASKS
jgi:hypothetical protein